MDEFLRYVLPLYDVVAFTLFDTFLLRPVFSSADLFSAIGGEEFAAARLKAEQDAGAKVKRPYTLDDIYEHIDPQFRSMKQR